MESTKSSNIVAPRFDFHGMMMILTFENRVKKDGLQLGARYHKEK